MARKGKKKKKLFVSCTTQGTESSFFTYAYGQLAFGSKLLLNAEKIKEQRRERRSRGGSREDGRGREKEKKNACLGPFCGSFSETIVFSGQFFVHSWKF